MEEETMNWRQINRNNPIWSIERKADFKLRMTKLWTLCEASESSASASGIQKKRSERGHRAF